MLRSPAFFSVLNVLFLCQPAPLVEQEQRAAEAALCSTQAPFV